MQGACVAAVDFINMMTRTGRLPAAAHILRYVETTGLLDGPTWATQVADARAQLAVVQPAAQQCGNDRQALEYMRGALTEPLEDIAAATIGAGLRTDRPTTD